MVKQEDRITYGELCYIAEDTFHRFNGWINPNFKASNLIFDDNKETILAMALGNIVVIFPRNILKFYYEALAVDLTKQQMKSCIIFLVVHELSHLEQDFVRYQETFKKPWNLVIEGSNNANTYNYLLAAQNQGIIDQDIDLMWPGFWHNILDSDKTYKGFLDKYYRIPSTLDKVIYCLSLLCMDYKQLKKILDKYLNVAIRYTILDNFVFEEVIKVNGMYIHPYTIMNTVVNRIFLAVYSGFNTAFYSQVYVKKKTEDFIIIKINNTEKQQLQDVVVKVEK